MSSDRAAPVSQDEINPSKEGTPIPLRKDENENENEKNPLLNSPNEDAKEEKDDESAAAAAVSHGNLFQITSAFNALATNMTNMVEQLHMQATTLVRSRNHNNNNNNNNDKMATNGKPSNNSNVNTTYKNTKISTAKSSDEGTDNHENNNNNKNKNNNVASLQPGSIIPNAYVESIQTSISSLMHKLNSVGIAINFEQLKLQQSEMLNNFNEQSNEYYDSIQHMIPSRNDINKNISSTYASFPKVPELSEFQKLMDSIAPPVFNKFEISKNSSEDEEASILAAYAMGEALDNDNVSVVGSNTSVKDYNYVNNNENNNNNSLLNMANYYLGGNNSERQKQLIIYNRDRLYEIKKSDFKGFLKQIWNRVLKYQKKGGKRIYTCQLFIDTFKENMFNVNKSENVLKLKLLYNNNEKIDYILTYVFWKIVLYLEKKKQFENLQKLEDNNDESLNNNNMNDEKLDNNGGISGIMHSSFHNSEIAAQKVKEIGSKVASSAGNAAQKFKSFVGGIGTSVSQNVSHASANISENIHVGSMGWRESMEKMFGAGGAVPPSAAAEAQNDKSIDVSNAEPDKKPTPVTPNNENASGNDDDASNNKKEENSGESNDDNSNVNVNVNEKEKANDLLPTPTAETQAALEQIQQQQQQQHKKIETFDMKEEYFVPYVAFEQVMCDIFEEITKNMKQHNDNKHENKEDDSKDNSINNNNDNSKSSVAGRQFLKFRSKLPFGMSKMKKNKEKGGANNNDNKEISPSPSPSPLAGNNENKDNNNNNHSNEEALIESGLVKDFLDGLISVGMWYIIDGKARDTWMAKRFNTNPKSKLSQLVISYHRYKQMLPLKFTPDGISLFHLMIGYDIPLMFGILMKVYPNFDEFKDDRGMTPTDWAHKYGRWEIFEKILYAKMGDKMKQKVISQRNKVDKQRGVVRQFIRCVNGRNNNIDNNNQNVNESMQFLHSIIIELIEKRLPLSDDLLLLCWKYELETNDNPFESKLWKTIESVCENVLSLPLNRKEWIWFQLYLFNSSIWYETGNKQQQQQRPLFSNDEKKSDNDMVTTSAAAVSPRMGNEGKESDNNNNNNNNNEIGDIYDLTIYCDCGNEMEVTLPFACYNAAATCNGCRRHVTGVTYFYHCRAGQHATSRGGIDYCLDCAKEKCQPKSNNNKNENKNDNNNDDSKFEEKENDDNSNNNNNKSNNNNDRVSSLYNRLLEITNSRLVTQYEFLKESINNVKNMENGRHESIAFDSLITYGDYIVCDPNIGIRQDGIIDAKTGKQLLSHPNVADFEHSKLAQIQWSMQNSVKPSNINIIQHYDINCYLPKLIIIANDLNSHFHNTMIDELFQIDRKTMRNEMFGIKYHAGAVKTIDRAQHKAETDYGDRSFPNSACITDFLRCEICCDTPMGMLTAMQIVKEAVNTRETCLKQIVRIKNLFESNRQKYFSQKKKDISGYKMDRSDLEWLYKYADIKMNVLIEYDNKSMICEIQFLLDFMSKAKSLAHGLYEITRNESFINDMTRIFNLSENKFEQLLFNVNSGNLGELETGQLLLGYNDELNLFNMDESGMSAIHYACYRGYSDILKLFISFYRSNMDNNNDNDNSENNNENLLNNLLNLRANATYNLTPLFYAARGGHSECVKILLNENGIDVNMLDNDNVDIVQNALSLHHSDCALLVWNDKRFNKIDSLNRNVIHNATYADEDIFIEEILKDRNLKELETILNKYDAQGVTPLIWSYDKRIQSKKGNKSSHCFNLLLNDPRCDVTKANSQGMNILMIACANNDIEIVGKLLLMKKININAQCNEGKTALIYCLSNQIDKRDTLEVMKFLLEQDGIDPNLKTKRNRSPLDWCMFKGFSEGCELLLERKDVYTNIEICNSALIVAAQLPQRRKQMDEWIQSVKLSKMIVAKQSKVDLNHTLREACYEGHFPMIDWLLNLTKSKEYINGIINIDINNCNENGFTPLLSAVSNQQFDVIKKLCKIQNINIKCKTINGENIITLAKNKDKTFKKSLYAFLISKKIFYQR